MPCQTPKEPAYSLLVQSDRRAHGLGAERDVCTSLTKSMHSPLRDPEWVHPRKRQRRRPISEMPLPKNGTDSPIFQYSSKWKIDSAVAVQRVGLMTSGERVHQVSHGAIRADAGESPILL